MEKVERTKKTINYSKTSEKSRSLLENSTIVFFVFHKVTKKGNTILTDKVVSG